jgi:nitrite reductase (NADH) small subunit
MVQRVSLCRAEDVPVGEGRAFECGGMRIAVFHTRNGSVFATAADCPHRKGPLADGLVGNEVVLCPLHEKSFNLHTGHASDGTCSVPTYKVIRAQSGWLEVEFERAS